MKGVGEAHAAALQTSSKEAWVAQATDVAALRVECAVTREGKGREWTSYALAMVARIHLPKVAAETFLPRDAVERKQGGLPSGAGKRSFSSKCARPS